MSGNEASFWLACVAALVAGIAAISGSLTLSNWLGYVGIICLLTALVRLVVAG